MNTQANLARTIIAVLAVAGSAFAVDTEFARKALAARSGPVQVTAGVADPNSNPHGAPYGVWGARWWQWVLSLPVHSASNVVTHPLLTDGPVNCAAGQAGAVWFLAGNFGGLSDRTCTIPSGKALFFPILNAWVDNTGINEPTQFTLKELQGFAAAISEPTVLFVTIDGAPVPLSPKNRGVAVFQYRLPNQDNFLQFLGASVPGPGWPHGNTPVGTVVAPAASDGHWLLVEPLSPGPHLISFGGASVGGFSLAVTYHITVE